MKIQAVTISVTNLEQSKLFYEAILSFNPDAYYEPTQWQSYETEGRAFFAITEVTDLQRGSSQDIINFIVPDVRGLWEKVRDNVQVESEPELMPWGTFKMIILDPDGYRLGFVEFSDE